MPELRCPDCASEVPAVGISSGEGLGTGSDDIPARAPMEYATCAGCGTTLERNVAPPHNQWRRVPDPLPD
jgi:hypothetical protein